MRIHHYGLATENIEMASEAFKALGYKKVDKPVLDPSQKAKVVFIFREGEPLIELVCDAETDGPVKNILSKIGSGLYHICYEVDNLKNTIAILRSQGYLLWHKPVPAIAFDNKRIAWLYNRYIGLVELVEA